MFNQTTKMVFITFSHKIEHD
uniref:Uncharacterized protein n=1 Tax=Arundo donax TaxID=35708 RepID=A0A0A9CBV3_ARUDO